MTDEVIALFDELAAKRELVARVHATLFKDHRFAVMFARRGAGSRALRERAA